MNKKKSIGIKNPNRDKVIDLTKGQEVPDCPYSSMGMHVMNSSEYKKNKRYKHMNQDNRSVCRRCGLVIKYKK